MILFFEAKSVSKELKARGRLTAKTKVRRGLYDVVVGDSRFRSLLVFEPHISSSVPQRALALECEPDSFQLEQDIRNRLQSDTKSIAFIPIASPDRPGDRPSEQFELLVNALYTYVTLHGSLLERPPDQSDGLYWVLARKTEQEESAPESRYLFACVLASTPDHHQFRKQMGSQEDVAIPIKLAGQPGQLRKRGNQLEMTFTDNSNLSDALASMLASGHRCLIPLGVNESCAAQQQESASSVIIDWIKVGF